MSTNYLKNRLIIENVFVEKLVNKYQTPFYVYSTDAIIKNYKLLKKKLSKNIFYSVKANSNQSIIKLLSKLGSGFDIVSEEELQRVLNAKVNPNKIIFEGVGKTKGAIKIAIKNNIRQINIESINEIILVNGIAKSLNKKANIGLRINPNIDSKTNNKISTARKTDKFGIDVKDIKKAIDIIKDSKNISFFGISCHLGSQIFSLIVYEKAFIKMKKIINFFENNEISVKHLDLGGGMGFDNNRKLYFKIEKFNKIIKKHFKNEKYEISFEPGRFLVANSGTLISKILMIKKSGGIDFIIIDAGMNTFIRPALYNSFHNIVAMIRKKSYHKYVVAGPICETSDIFAKNIILPKLNINDILAIQDVGAYGSVMSSNYNSKILPMEIMINKNRHSIIRKSQNIRDLILKDKIPIWIKNIKLIK